ncbi:uncharacterized protein N7496_012464 [Penicillium cataractarum]|uniref:Ig-like domain-containing protein n=1 Tax=Penicillium cataractarum TaxID=2100454 RepID=A0A9W9R7V4_9EURO|nr:uncharacterized protein N7496_012464 [Penicillium cataractarum]KAJ5355252.1 hypothetical protein N7496_012464 [Penicillium cataractarum]
MRFHTVALLTGATAAAAGNTATLLLPGFQGRNLEAGIISKAGDATTYLVTCPTTVASADCGIPGKGMTAVAAPSSAELYQAYADGSTATVSCAVAGTTYASCSAAQGTVTVEHTLDSKNINWMPVTVTGDCSTSTPTPTPTPTITTTEVTQTSTSTSSPISSPIKSTSRPASSTPVASSTPLAPSQTGASTSAPAATQPAAPNAAVSLAGNGWTLGGAVLAMVYALV